MLAVVFLVIRTNIVGFIDSRSSPSIFDNPFLRSTTSERYATAVAMLGRYLVYTIFPLNLSHEYVYNELVPVGWTHWQTIVSLVVHLALVGFAAWKLREKHVLSYAILYYLATISIVSNIAFSIGALFGERFLFMPSVGASLAYAWLLCWFLAVRPSEASGKSQGSKPRIAWALALGVAGLIVAVYSVRTITRNPAWTNEDTLLLADVESTPNSLRNRRVYAGFLLRDAKNATSPEQMERCLQLAYGHLKYCIEQDSTVDDKAFFNLGQYYGMFRSNVDSAVIHYRKAYQLRSDDSTNYVYYSFNVGNQHLSRKEYDTAIAIYKRVMPLGIELETLNFNIGVALVGKEMYAEALPWFEAALKVNPKNPAIPNAIAICQQEIANRKLTAKQ
jgi:tetratricopeptide (TPR) repeat protein